MTIVVQAIHRESGAGGSGEQPRQRRLGLSLRDAGGAVDELLRAAFAVGGDHEEVRGLRLFAHGDRLGREGERVAEAIDKAYGSVTPAKAGVQKPGLDSRFRGNDEI